MSVTVARLFLDEKLSGRCYSCVWAWKCEYCFFDRNTAGEWSKADENLVYTETCTVARAVHVFLFRSGYRASDGGVWTEV